MIRFAAVVVRIWFFGWIQAMGLLRTYRTQQSDLESIMEGLGITAYRTWAEGKFIPLLALLGRRGGTAQVNLAQNRSAIYYGGA